MHAIKTERARLQELVQDYLSLARLSEVRREPEDLGAMLQAVGQELQTAVKATLTTAVATQGSEHARCTVLPVRDAYPCPGEGVLAQEGGSALGRRVAPDAEDKLALTDVH
jgi:hypothetical protein